VSGGGSADASASDSTIIAPNPVVLSVSKSHIGVFVQGQHGVAYTVLVSNVSSAGPTSGTVTVTDTPPPGLTIVTMAGSGWQCTNSACTRSDVLAPGMAYPPIVVAVNVAVSASSPQVNTVTVNGGGSTAVSATDSSQILASDSDDDGDGLTNAVE